MVPPDPAGANDRAGLVKEGHLPSLASLPMPLIWGRGAGMVWQVVEQKAASGLAVIVYKSIVFLAAPTEQPLFRY